MKDFLVMMNYQEKATVFINQKKLLEKYATEQGFTNIAHYADDGWSGTNFERPDWKRLLTNLSATILNFSQPLFSHSGFK